VAPVGLETSEPPLGLPTDIKQESGTIDCQTSANGRLVGGYTTPAIDNGYPPDKQAKATVLEQAERLCEEWAA